MTAGKRILFLCAAILLMGSVFSIAEAAVTVTPATGGSSISADTTGGSYSSLTDPVISEGATGDIGTGTIILNAPSGFIFDTGGVAPTVLVTRIGGSGNDNRNINDLGSGSTIAVTVSASQLTITITAATSNNVRNSLTWQNVRVRPSAGTPLATGNITSSGTSSILGVTAGSTNFGTLTEVVGAKTQVVITTEPSSTATTATDFGTKPVVAIRDQFGNTVTTDSSSTVTRTAVLSTQSCGGTVGSGTLSSTPASGSAVTSGVLAYTTMQYSAAEAIKICFASTGITSALSTTITVSAPPDTTAPSAVSNLALSGATVSSINVSWTAPGDDNNTGTATTYDLRYSTSAITSGNFSSATQVTGEPIPSVAGSSESMTVSGLSPSTTYYFALKTSDEVPNTSTISNVPNLSTSAPPDTTTPSAVSNLALSGATNNSINVSWTAPGDDGGTGTATGYDLRYSTSLITSANFSSATAVAGEPTPSLAGSSESMTVSGLSQLTTYYFALKTSDEVPNTSAISNVPSLSTTATPDTTAPAAVSNLTLSGATNNSINVSWTAPGDDGGTGTATGYDLRYSTSLITSANFSSATAVAGEPTPSLAGSSESMTVSGLSQLTTYYFALKTSDEVPNTSAISNVPSLSTTATPDTTAPAAVSNLTLSGASNNTIDVSWTAPGDDNTTGTVTVYDLRYSTSAITSGNFSSATQVVGEPTPSIAGSSESMTVTGLSPSTTYYFALKSSDEVPNTSAISNLPNLSTTATPDTTAPGAVSNLAVANPTTSTLDVSWSAPGDDGNIGTATTYDLRYSTSAITSGNFSSATQFVGEPTPSAAGISETATVTGLVDNTTYHFALKTSDEVPNTSTISNVPSGTTALSADVTAPAAVTTLALSGASDSAITVSWTAPGDNGSTGTATLYDLRYSTVAITSGNFSSATQVVGEPTPSIAGSSESKTVTGLSANTTYYFALKTSDEAGNASALSNVPSLATTNAPDTTAPSAVTNLALSSPTSSAITVSWTAPGDDGGTGTATEYDLRYGTALITSANFFSATQVTGEPTPAAGGTTESMAVTGLGANTIYYFALKTSDEVPNTSALSNVPNEQTAESQSSIVISQQGGGGSPSTASFSGQAYPGSKVLVLRKGKLDGMFHNVPLSSSHIDGAGKFNISYLGLLSSEYLFALQAVDKNGRKTGLMTFNADLLSQNLTVEDLLLTPTLGFKSETVKRGGLVEIEGYATPRSIVELDIAGRQRGETRASETGYWSYATATPHLTVGPHSVRVRQVVKETGIASRASDYSLLTSFRVTNLSTPLADLNNDEAVNIVDWSIFLFRWSSKDTTVKQKVDIDGDGKITIADFSLFLAALKF